MMLRGLQNLSQRDLARVALQMHGRSISGSKSLDRFIKSAADRPQTDFFRRRLLPLWIRRRLLPLWNRMFDPPFTT
jgi:hypothetical protein